MYVKILPNCRVGSVCVRVPRRTPNRPDLPTGPREPWFSAAHDPGSRHTPNGWRTLAGTGSVRYLATSRRDPSDVDWEDRVEQHRVRRPATWTTIETAPGRDLAEQLRSSTDAPVTLVDDLGTWLTVEFDAAGAWDLPRGTSQARLRNWSRASATTPVTSSS